MKKLFLAVVLASTAGAAAAETIVPAGADLPAHIKSLTARKVRVEVVKPHALNTVWDQIAASLVGCRIDGSRLPSAGGRMSLTFDTLQCPGKPAIAIEAFGVDDVKLRVDLENTATVGTKLSVLVLRNISLPSGKPWTDKIH